MTRYTIVRSSVEWMKKTFGIEYILYAIRGPGLEKPYVVGDETKALKLCIVFESVFLAGQKSRGGTDDTT